MRLTGRFYLFPSPESSWLPFNNVFLKHLWLSVKFREFLDDIWTNVTEFILNLLSGLPVAVGLSPVKEKRQNKIRDVAPGNRMDLIDDPMT